MGGGFVGGSVSTTINPEVAKRLQTDLKALVEILNESNQEEIYSILKSASGSLGLDANDSELLINVLRQEFPDFALEIRPSIFERWSVLRDGIFGITHSGIMAEQGAEFIKNINPSGIGIVTINKNQIPKTALVSDFDIGFPQGSDEIRIYSDIPLR